MVDQRDEASSPSPRPILAEDCVVREGRQRGCGGGEFRFLDTCYYAAVVAEQLEELPVRVEDSDDVNLKEMTMGLRCDGTWGGCRRGRGLNSGRQARRAAPNAVDVL